MGEWNSFTHKCIASHILCLFTSTCQNFFNWMTSVAVWSCKNSFILYDSSDFRPSMERNQERNRLRIYKIYAFGIPLLIAGIAAMRHSSSSSTAGDDVYLQPRFCETEYWFAGKFWANGEGDDEKKRVNIHTYSFMFSKFFGVFKIPNWINGPAIMKWIQRENPRLTHTHTNETETWMECN